MRGRKSRIATTTPLAKGTWATQATDLLALGVSPAAHDLGNTLSYHEWTAVFLCVLAPFGHCQKHPSHLSHPCQTRTALNLPQSCVTHLQQLSSRSIEHQGQAQHVTRSL